ncbi:TRAP transporter substrate-binding protein [Sedimentibacter sp.]|uniref:TRAP transporter substrate-binding protein n=1 Tax=Sedimentibacter sp. TaxID=1960295 RepID=UPI0028967E62|nr:TRAP transporter substrate-binding protein [Sedimentibacter sp.]
MKKMLSIVLVAALLVTSLVGCSAPSNNPKDNTSSAGNNSDEVYEFKLGHQSPEGEPYDLVAHKFKELIEERTNGQIKITVYPHAQLGYDRNLMEGIQFGSLDFAVVAGEAVGGFVPKANVLTLPFIFRGFDHAHSFARSETTAEFYDSFKGTGLVPLGLVRRGFRSVTSNTKPVYEPSDLKGMKLRVVENPMYIDTFTALGSVAIPMAWGEVYVAMQQGTIDGHENSPEIISAYRIWEVQKYYSLTEHVFAFGYLMTGDHMMDKLPENLQAEVKKASFDAVEEVSLHLENEFAETMKLLEANGFEINEVNNKEDFKALVEPVYEKFIKEHGSSIVDLVQNIK